MLFAMYLRVSDLVGRGNRWFHVDGKGNKAAKVRATDDYIDTYLVRYCRHLQLPPLPLPESEFVMNGGLWGLLAVQLAGHFGRYQASSNARDRETTPTITRDKEPTFPRQW